MKILTGAKVTKLEKKADGVTATIDDGKGGTQSLSVDRVISAVGVVGNVENLGLEKLGVKIDRGTIVVDGHGRTNVAGLYAIGDVAGPPMLAHKAEHEGVICVEAIKGLNPHALDKLEMPGCTYCHPQIASVGLTEKAAKEQGREIKVGRFPFVGNGKAIALGEDQGLVKTVFDAKTGQLLGAHLVGAEVTELIQGFAIAMQLETTEEELMHTVFPHPDALRDDARERARAPTGACSMREVAGATAEYLPSGLPPPLAPPHQGEGNAQVSRPLLIVFCGLLLTVSAFSCDITLPAFWSMQADLGAPIAWVQAVVPVFLISQGIGQLVFGPVSDRYGRRPVILAGLLLYLLGVAIAGLAHSIGMVHAGRVTQGFGSACGIVVARAVLRDVSHGTALAQSMALAMAIFSLGPISAPLLGYGLVALSGWRGVFAGMAACSPSCCWRGDTSGSRRPTPRRTRRRCDPPGYCNRCAASSASSSITLFSHCFGGDAVRHRVVRRQRSAFLQVGVRHRGAGVRFAVCRYRARDHPGPDRQQPADRPARRAGDHPAGSFHLGGGDRGDGGASGGRRYAGRGVCRPDVRVQHQLPGGDRQFGKPGNRSASRDRRVRLVGLWLRYADHGIGADDPDRAAVCGSAPALEPHPAGCDGERVRSGHGAPASARSRVPRRVTVRG